MYRWGFRQLHNHGNSNISNYEPTIFGNDYFHIYKQNNMNLLIHMKSRTAASIRKRESNILRDILHLKNRDCSNSNTNNPQQLLQQ